MKLLVSPLDYIQCQQLDWIPLSTERENTLCFGQSSYQRLKKSLIRLGGRQKLGASSPARVAQKMKNLKHLNVSLCYHHTSLKDKIMLLLIWRCKIWRKVLLTAPLLHLMRLSPDHVVAPVLPSLAFHALLNSWTLSDTIEASASELYKLSPLSITKSSLLINI